MANGISFGIVKNTIDPTNAGRIQVRVPYDDLKENDEELEWAFPLLPKMLHVRPKIGETVMIINRDFDNERSGRYYLGPVISQPQFMYEELNENSALRVLQGTRVGADKNPETDPIVKGTIPDNEDVAILGRKDSDIILKDDDIRIRCGVKKTDAFDKTKFAFNSVHPAFIKMKHMRDYDERNLFYDGPRYESVINVVADKINLIGTDARDKFNANDPDELINDEEVSRFITEAHQLPFGDKLIEFLRIFITAFQSHTHPWVGRGQTPCKDITYNALANYNLESMLSTTIRIN
jgi:hypothetical protein